MIKQPEKVTCLTIISILLISTFAFLLPVNASTVFSDDFSSGNFNAWTSTYANPTMSGGIATFTVTQHDGAGCYAEKTNYP